MATKISSDKEGIRTTEWFEEDGDLHQVTEFDDKKIKEFNMAAMHEQIFQGKRLGLKDGDVIRDWVAWASPEQEQYFNRAYPDVAAALSDPDEHIRLKAHDLLYEVAPDLFLIHLR